MVALLISYNPVLKLREINHMYSGHYYCYGVYPNMRNHYIAKRLVKVNGNPFKYFSSTYLNINIVIIIPIPIEK